jgi:hypothetical protein
MAVVNGYLTGQQAQDYIGRQYTDQFGILNDIVTAVSRQIDRHCGRHFYRDGTTGEPVARYFEVDDPCELELGVFNDLVSVTSLKVDSTGDGTYDSTITNYVLCPKGAATRAPVPEPYTEIELLTGTTFPLGVTTGREYLIEVAGVWGWPEVPAEITQAARILVHEMAKVQDAPLGLVGSPEFGMSRVPGYMPRHARELLAPYRHPDVWGIG